MAIGGSGSEASASAAGSAAVSISGPRGPETSAAASDVGGRRQTGGWRQFRRRALSETYDTPAPRLPRAVQPYRFFVYSGALNQSWLRHCHGFNALERSAAAWSKCCLCSALARLLHLLRARLAVLGGSRHPGREAGPLGGQQLP